MIPRSIGGALALLLAGSPLASAVAPSTPDWTTKHEAGRCAIRGNCGKQSFFGSELPCPDNGLAEEPEAGVRDRLVKICGEKWSDGKVCCKAEQVSYCTAQVAT